MGYGWVVWIWGGCMVSGVKVYIGGLVRVGDRECISCGRKNVLMHDMDFTFDICRFISIGGFFTLL